MANLTRRAAVIGATASSVALAFPVINAVSAAARLPSDSTIAELFANWRAAADAVSAAATEAESSQHFRAYVRLQRRITAMAPTSARDAAMQFVVETDDGGSDYRDTFFRRVRKLAMEG